MKETSSSLLGGQLVVVFCFERSVLFELMCSGHYT